MTDSTEMPSRLTCKGLFTATAILKWCRRKLSLNDSITKFFPGLPYPGVTVKDVIGVTGIVNYIHLFPAIGIKKYVTNDMPIAVPYNPYANPSRHPTSVLVTPIFVLLI